MINMINRIITYSLRSVLVSLPSVRRAAQADTLVGYLWIPRLCEVSDNSWRFTTPSILLPFALRLTSVEE